MYLPDYVTECIQTLEAAGYPAYAVGGCVRDACLGLTPHDYDLCTAALPEETEAVFQNRPMFLSGKKHGTVSVIQGKEVVEITTFRTEGDYADNRRPDWVKFVPDVKEDLARRDFTINAMAYSPTRGYADPFGGREDLKKGILRAVGDPAQRFREDSLRILRGVRFAVKYRLEVEEATFGAMKALSPLMENLSRERVFSELCGLLPHLTAEDLRRFAPILTQVIPELAPLVGFDQRSRHHAYDLYTHTALVVEGVPGELPLRWAALLHDIGKPATFTLDQNGQGHFYGHAPEGAAMADGILRRLKAPNALREQVVLLIEKHMTRLMPDKRLLRRALNRLGADTVETLLALQTADMGSKGTGREESTPFLEIPGLLRQIQAENACFSLKDLAVNGSDLMALGYSGRAVGVELQRLLELVMAEALPNEKEALLAAARERS